MYNTIIDILGMIAFGGLVIFGWLWLTGQLFDVWYKNSRKKVPMHDVDAKRNFSKLLKKAQTFYKLQMFTFGLIVYTILTILTF